MGGLASPKILTHVRMYAGGTGSLPTYITDQSTGWPDFGFPNTNPPQLVKSDIAMTDH